MPGEDDPASLEGLSWNTERTLYRFFVCWEEDDENVCCLDAERAQVAISLSAAMLTCLSCGTEWEVEVEVAEVII